MIYFIRFDRRINPIDKIFAVKIQESYDVERSFL